MGAILNRRFRAQRRTQRMELETEQHALPQGDMSASGDQSSLQTRLAAGTQLNMCAVDSANGGAL